ncbi:MAG: DUF58 domain-containing protein [Proteobacteria bacterium]|nr:DUF58 domain-containing protein [Pseudomonadota bacterium]
MSKTFVLERLPHSVTHTTARKHIPRQRIYIFAGRYGLIFCAMLIVMLLGAVNYNNSMSYMLTFLLCSLFMVCMLHTYRNLRGLMINAADSRPVFAGETAYFPLLIDNRLGQTRIAIDIHVSPKHRPKKQTGQTYPDNLCINVNAGDLISKYLSMPAHKRGILKPGRLRITSTFPLGLFRVWSYVEAGQSCLVYPQPAGNSQLPLASEHDAQEQAGVHDGTDDFTGFKPYRPGDSIRKINWKALAREQGLLVKHFSGSGSDKLMLHWGQCQHMTGTEQRLSQMCLWIIEADKQGIYYGLDIAPVTIDFGKGDSHKHQCLAALATYGFAIDKV